MSLAFQLCVVIPYFSLPIFGLLSTAGIALGMYLSYRRAEQIRIQEDYSWIALVVVCGFIGSHAVDVFAYRCKEFMNNPAILWDPRHGWSLSSYGGFLGGLIAAIVWSRRNNAELLPYLDALAYGLAPGFVVGRTGCFLVHDHIGSRTTSALGVAFSNGVRHDLGLYEAILCAAISATFVVLFKWRPPVGSYFALFCISYGPARFVLEFLRAVDIPYPDTRFLGFTPAQYGSAILTIIGMCITLRLCQRQFRDLHRTKQMHARAATAFVSLRETKRWFAKDY